MEEWKSNTVMSKHQQPFLLEEQGSFWREIAGLAATNHSCLRTRARETESTRVDLCAGDTTFATLTMEKRPILVVEY